jgi:hypothetical protein
MIVLVTLDRESNDDGIQKSGVVNSDVAAAKIVSYVELEFVSSGDHRITVEQRLLRSSIGIACGSGDLLTPISKYEQSNRNTSGWAALRGVKDMCA